MSSDGSKPAFPADKGMYDKEGLTHREWLVGIAMGGLLASVKRPDVSYLDRIVDLSYQMADRTLAKNLASTRPKPVMPTHEAHND